MDHDDAETIRFTRAMRNARRGQGITLNELAENVGASQSYLSRVELGQIKHPNRETLEAAAKLLGIAMPGSAAWSTPTEHEPTADLRPATFPSSVFPSERSSWPSSSEKGSIPSLDKAIQHRSDAIESFKEGDIFEAMRQLNAAIFEFELLHLSATSAEAGSERPIGSIAIESDIHFRLADYYLDKRRLDIALREIDMSIEQRARSLGLPTSDSPHANIASLLGGSSERSDAVAAPIDEEMVPISELIRLRGAICGVRGDWIEAEQLLDSAERYAEQHAQFDLVQRIHQRRVWLFERQNRIEMAEAELAENFRSLGKGRVIFKGLAHSYDLMSRLEATRVIDDPAWPFVESKVSNDPSWKQRISDALSNAHLSSNLFRLQGDGRQRQDTRISAGDRRNISLVNTSIATLGSAIDPMGDWHKYCTDSYEYAKQQNFELGTMIALRSRAACLAVMGEKEPAAKNADRAILVAESLPADFSDDLEIARTLHLSGRILFTLAEGDVERGRDAMKRASSMVRAFIERNRLQLTNDHVKALDQIARD